jgi:hypothetical protein
MNREILISFVTSMLPKRTESSSIAASFACSVDDLYPRLEGLSRSVILGTRQTVAWDAG